MYNCYIVIVILYIVDILTTSPHYVYRKCVRAANENLNFDLRVKTVKAPSVRGKISSNKL